LLNGSGIHIFTFLDQKLLQLFIRLEENSCKSATEYPLSSIKIPIEKYSAPVEGEVSREHLNHCPASWSKTLTGTTLNVDLDLELQLQNTLQAFGEL
jgi:hypothetical protein